MIDKYAHGKINADNLRVFLAQHDCACEIEHTDITTWIRRFDKDVDGGLKFVDLVTAMQTMTNYNPKNVQRANDMSRQDEQNREEMYNIGMNQASGTTLNSGEMRMAPAHIQIEDMNGMVNMTQDYERKGLSGINSDSQSMMVGTKGDRSRVGHITRNTDYTSNLGVHTTQDIGHGANRT